MEIVFNKLSYIENKNSSLERKFFDSVSFKISEGSVIGFVTYDLRILNSLLTVVKRPTKGEIIIGDMSIKRTTHIDNINSLRKNIGYVSYRDNVFFKSTVKEEIQFTMDNFSYEVKNLDRHLSSSMKMVLLDDTYLDRDPNSLSFTEKKKVMLGVVLSYNPNVIILDDFFDGFTYKEKVYFKKLFIKLKSNFKKTIIVLDSNVSNMFDFVDNFYVMHKGSIILEGNKDSFYDDRIYQYYKMPKIVEFTKYVNNRGNNIIKYTDKNELIKELYRNVK